MCFDQVEESGEERIVNIDGAVSAEHATIEYESETGISNFHQARWTFLLMVFCPGRFFIKDGVAKPSTNGTWIR